MIFFYQKNDFWVDVAGMIIGRILKSKVDEKILREYLNVIPQREETEFTAGYQDYLQGRSLKSYKSYSYDKNEDRQGPFQFQMREGRCVDL